MFEKQKVEPPKAVKEKEATVPVEMDKEIALGRYSNMLNVSHTREEFVFDFMNIIPPKGLMVSRVFTSPQHAKRIIEALLANIKSYEEHYGVIKTD